MEIFAVAFSRRAPVLLRCERSHQSPIRRKSMRKQTSVIIALSLALMLIACASRMSTAQEGPMPKTISYSRIVDLSHTIATDIPLWPGGPPVEFQTVTGTTLVLGILRLKDGSGTPLSVMAFVP
jgi:hypothetical protein